MPAHVVEPAQPLLRVTCNQQRLADMIEREVIPGFRDLLAAPHDLPGFMKNAVLLVLEQRGINIEIRGQRERAFQLGNQWFWNSIDGMCHASLPCNERM